MLIDQFITSRAFPTALIRAELLLPPRSSSLLTIATSEVLALTIAHHSAGCLFPDVPHRRMLYTPLLSFGAEGTSLS